MFKTKRNLVILSLFFVTILLGLDVANAYSSVLLTITTKATKQGTVPNQQCMTHDNELVRVTSDYQNKQVHIWVYSQTGVQIAYRTHSFTASTSNNQTDVTVQYYNESYCLILLTWNKQPSMHEYHVQAVWFNDDSFVLTASNDLTLAGGGAGSASGLRLSKAFPYNGKMWFIQRQFTTTAPYLDLIELSGNTITVRAHVDLGTGGGLILGTAQNINVIQDSTFPQYLYIMTCLGTTDTQPEYIQVDLSSYAVTSLAVHPNPNQWGYLRRHYFINGGVVYNGTLIYVFFTWFYTTWNVNHIILAIQHRLVFNNSVGVGTLIAQNTRIITYSLNHPVGDTEPCWAVGYNEPVNSSVYFLYYPEYYGGTWYTFKRKLFLPDWFDYSSTQFNQVDSTQWNYGESPEIAWEGTHEEISRDFGTSMQSSEWRIDLTLDSGVYIKIYYGLGEVSVTYDLTLTHNPNDNPLVRDKPYSFTCTAYANGLGSSVTSSVQINDITYSTKKHDSNGVRTWTYTYGLSGILTITVKILSGGMVVYQETWNYTVVDSEPEIPTTGYVMPVYITTLVNGIVPLVLLFLPPVILLPLGIFGIITGLTIGVLVGVLSGALPFYTVYLYGFMVILGVVYLARRG